jgi:hypothetical protein
MTLRTPNCEEQMGKEGKMGSDSPGQCFTS